MGSDFYDEILTIYDVSNILDISVERIKKWVSVGRLSPIGLDHDGNYTFSKEQLSFFEIANQIFNSNWDDFITNSPNKDYYSIELFAGAGGMAIGMEKAGFKHLALNEIDKWSCETLRKNRPNWNVIEGDISTIDFSEYKDKVDLITGGFPCQAFSYAGKKLGFEDTRGTLFFEFARSIHEIKPKIFIGENVRGLYNHDGGRTLEVIKSTISELGYTLVDARVLKAMYYKVPQKRERLFLIGVRNDLSDHIHKFKFPPPYKKVLTLKDTFNSGTLYSSDVPESEGEIYPKRKREIMEKVPEGGYWKDLPENLQKEYMGGSFYLGGGKTGLARRLSLKHPSLTLVTAAAMKQTERCHPIETRPLTVRESARIQTFPDKWEFVGSRINKYKQIGNAVPVNLAWAVGVSTIRFLDEIS